MVLLNGNKYACETCIKGHRSSTCRHTDRPLFEIKKKGRPITQCEHCRELRKTKQVHVKCVCEGKDELLPKEPPGIKKGHTLIPGSAAFPQGLPEALGASVAIAAHSRSSGPASVSDTGGRNEKQCCCKSDDACKCWWPRKHAPRRKSKKSDASPPVPSSPTAPSEEAVIATNNPPAASHILARLAELRPVLPRPVAVRSSTDLAHDPSSGVAHAHVRHHGHETAFSPYGRAYDYSREPVYMGEPGGTELLLPQDAFSISEPNQAFYTPSDASTISSEEQMLREQLRALEEVVSNTEANTDQMVQNPESLQQNSTLPTFIPPFPSSCNCGDNCLCPGCFQHNAKNAASIPLSSAFSSCMNPGQCTSCLDCTILALPASLPADTSVSIYDAYGTESIDDWIRQMSQLPPASSQQMDGSSLSSTPSPVSDEGLSKQTPRMSNAVPVPPKACCAAPSNPDWEGFVRDNRLPPVKEPARVGAYVVQPCCGVLCKCDPEECQCEVDKNGGYDCRREMLFPSEQIVPATNYEDSASMLVDPYDGMIRSFSENGRNPFDSEAGPNESLTIPPSARFRSSSASTFSRPQMGRMNLVQMESPFELQDQTMGNVSQERSRSYYAGQSSMTMSTPNLPAMLDTPMDITTANMMDMSSTAMPAMRARGSSVSIPSSSSIYSPPGSRSVSPPSASSTGMPIHMTGYGNVDPGELVGTSAAPYAMSTSDSDTDGYTSDRFAGETGLW